ncbi:uncharacterized protein LOC135156775 [Lytechinus pictus]|uniref:uncharacterized protein LOC135156775 n=1 Tax=Lytechinus pictus TaxID=7653 RepID=UPI0030BA07DF
MADAFYRLNSRGKGGVALFIRKDSILGHKEIPSDSSRILAVQVKLKVSKESLTMICCYLPCGTSLKDQADYHTCLALIAHIRSTIPDSLIIAGDFNADIMNSSPTKKTEHLLLNFLDQEGLCYLSSELHHDGDYTYQTDDGRQRSYIDGFIVPTRDLALYQSLTITGEDSTNTSDHLMVLTYRQQAMTQDHVQRNLPAHSTLLKRLKIKWGACSPSEVRDKYTLPMERYAFQLFQNLDDTLLLDRIDTNYLLCSLTEAMVEISLSLPHCYPSTKKRGKPEWSPAVQAAYNQAQRAWRDWRSVNRPKAGHCYRKHLQSKKTFRSCLRQARASQKLSLWKQIEKSSHSNQSLFHHLVKRNKGSNSHQTQTNTLEYADQIYLDSEVLNGWHIYFSDLAHDPSTLHQANAAEGYIDTIETPDEHVTEGTPPPSTHPVWQLSSLDLRDAIARLKYGKASGPDNISSEHLKHLGEVSRRLLLVLLNAILHQGHCPQPLKSGIILPFHKGKGKCTEDPRNYRGITLTSTISKLLETCLKPLLEFQLSIKDIPDQLQFGFRRGFSCQLTALCLQLIIEVQQVEKRPTYVAFLDAEKAFDKVWHRGLLKKLRAAEPDHFILRTIESLYDGMYSLVYWDGKVSPPIHIQQGVRQGGVLSPSLYTLFIDGLIKTLRDKNLGCHINDRYAGVLVLADDVALLSNSATELQAMLDTTLAYSQCWRYKINPTKSAVVVMHPKKNDTQTVWKMGDSPISRKDCHDHLGIPKSGSRLDPTDQIISRGLKTFYALHGTGAHTLGLVPTLSSHLWNVYCIPRMLYGTAILHFTKAMEYKLDKAQNHLFKRVLGIPNTAANECVFLLTGLLPISARIDYEKLLLLGQLLNLDQTRFEYGTFLLALHANTQTIKTLRCILQKYGIPPLEDLLVNPIPYRAWKPTINKAINDHVQAQMLQGAASKPSLVCWTLRSFTDPLELYPKDPPSSIIRQALTVRAQLLTSTYLTQSRLCKIGKKTDPTCALCKLEEDTTEHILAKCPRTLHLRNTLLDKIRNLLKDFPSSTTSFNTSNPWQLTAAILLPYDASLPHPLNSLILKATLHFIFKLHVLFLSLKPVNSQ